MKELEMVVTTSGRWSESELGRSGAMDDDRISRPAITEPRFAKGTRRLPCLDMSEQANDRDILREEDMAQIVHDLKNPLTTIALEADVLDHRVERGDRADVLRAIARIKCNVAFLDRMVQNLQDLCSLDAGRFELHHTPTEMRGLLVDVIDRVVATRDRGRVFLEAPRPATLDIDDLRIERVVANLLANALAYAPATSGIVVRLDRRPGSCGVSVIDAGPGVTAEEATYIFDKYRRASSSHGRPGTGLGLYVSKKIVEAHGGRIGVDSIPGTGSRFYFELPLES